MAHAGEQASQVTPVSDVLTRASDAFGSPTELQNGLFENRLQGHADGSAKKFAHINLYIFLLSELQFGSVFHRDGSSLRFRGGRNGLRFEELLPLCW